MNKLFSKIAALSVGLTMAIGVGVAVGSKGARVAKAESTVSMSTFSAISGSVDSDPYITYEARKGSAANDPVVNSGVIRVYQNGGEFEVNAATGASMTSVTISSSMATSVLVSVDDTAEGSNRSITENGSTTVDSISASSVLFTCMGTDKYSRLYVKSLSVTYETGGGPVVTYTISYNSNGGSGTMSDSTGSNPSVAECTFTAPEGKQFQKWNTAANGSGADHAVGSKPKADLTLYAIWEDKPAEPITLNSSNWPVTGSSASDNVQEVTYDGIVYQNVRAYIYQNKLSLQYKVDSYFGNKTPYSRNIKSIVITYDSNITSYVKMYEGDEPLAKTSQVTQSGTTTVTYTFSDTRPYFRLNMDTKLPNKTYCNITSIVITFGSAADVVDLEDISLNGNKTLPVGVTFASVLTLDPANANNKDTIAWSSSNNSVATVDASGVITTVGVGEATITATATDLVGVSASYVVTVFEANPIEKIYYMESGAALDFNAVYVGFITGSGPVVMNGEYGILLYKSSMDVSSYTAGETILHVTGTLSIFSGLYEVNNPSVEVLESASDVSEPVTYSVTGSETYIHESRRTYVSGTVVSVSGGWTSDTTVVMDVNGHQIQCFAKGGSITDESVQQQIVADASVTLKGFSGWHNGFQVTIVGIVEAVDTYTAEDFAQDLLDSTDAVCVNYVDGESSYSEFRSEFQSIWNTLSSADKYQSLLPEQKSILAEADRDESGTVIEQAMARYDFLTGKYELDNFITGRTPVQFAHVGIGLNDVASDNNIMIIVVVIAAVSALAFTTLLVFKKKKQK